MLYYPEFAQLVDSIVERTEITGWMLDTKDKVIQGQGSQPDEG